MVIHPQISLRPAPVFTFNDSVPLGFHIYGCFSLTLYKNESVNIGLEEEDLKSPGQFEKCLEKPEFNPSYLNESFLPLELFLKKLNCFCKLFCDFFSLFLPV